MYDHVQACVYGFAAFMVTKACFPGAEPLVPLGVALWMIHRAVGQIRHRRPIKLHQARPQRPRRTDLSRLS